MKNRCLSFSNYLVESESQVKPGDFVFFRNQIQQTKLAKVFQFLDQGMLEVRQYPSGILMKIHEDYVLKEHNSFAKSIGEQVDRILNLDKQTFILPKGIEVLGRETPLRTAVSSTFIIFNAEESIKHHDIIVSFDGLTNDGPITKHDSFKWSEVSKYNNALIVTSPWYEVLMIEVQRELGTVFVDKHLNLIEAYITVTTPSHINIEEESKGVIRNSGVFEYYLISGSEPRHQEVSRQDNFKRTRIRVGCLNQEDIIKIYKQFELELRGNSAKAITINDSNKIRFLMSPLKIFKMAEFLNINVLTFDQDNAGDVYTHTLF